MRKKLENPHLGTHQNYVVKLQKYDIKQEDYGFKVTMFYEYIPKTLKDRVEELQMKGKVFSDR